MKAKNLAILICMFFLLNISLAYAVDINPVLEFDTDSTSVASTVQLQARAVDALTNPGILWIKLYEDDIEIDSKNCGGISTCLFVRDVTHASAENHSYKAEARDKGGHTVTSSSINVQFTGKTASTCSLVFNPVSPQTYGAPVNASCSCDNPEANTVLLRNGLDVTAAENNQAVVIEAGTHNYNCSVAETANYLSAENTSTYVVNQAPTVLTLTSLPSWTELEGTQTNVSCSADNAEVVVELYRNGTLVANPDVQTLANGTYNYTCNATASQNYTAPVQQQSTLTITTMPVVNVAWNQAVLDLGSGYQGAGALVGAENITSAGNNTNVTVACSSGNCTEITDNWVDGTNMLDGESLAVTFTCDDTNVGTYSAVFDVTSDDDTTPDQMTVSCDITAPDYVMINEFVVDPQTDWNGDNSTTGSDEWFELYNPTASDVDITGWNLTLTDTTPEVETLTGSVPAGGYLVVLNPVGEQNNDGQLVLSDSFGVVIDQVSYGNYDDGNTTDNAPDGIAADIYDECTARVPNGFDTNVDNVDFVKRRCTYNISNDDTTNPAVALELPADASTDVDGNVTVQYNATDDIATSLTCDIWSDTSGTWQIDSSGVVANGVSDTYDYTNLLNGNYQWNVECSDGTNSAFAAANYTFNVSVPDTTNPIVTLELPTDASIDYDGDVTIQYSVTDDMATSLTCDVYSNTTGTWQADATGQIVANGSSSTHNYPSLADGNYVWNVECNDGSNTDFAAVNYTFSVDTSIPDVTPPVVSLDLPADASLENGDVTVQYSVTDDLASSLTCDIYSDTSGTWQADATGQIVVNGGSGSYNYSSLTDGTYNWNVECSDGTNPAFAATNNTFVVDVTAPTINIISPVTQTYTTSSVLINITASDANGVNEILYNIDGGSNSTYTVPVNTGVLADATYTLNVYATDNVGNLNSASVTFTIETDGEMNGTVNDNFANPLDNVNVSVDGTELNNFTAVGTGAYSILDITPGTYSVTATPPTDAHLSQTKTGQVVNADTITTVDFVLTQTGTINGTVYDFWNFPATFSGATVTVFQSGVEINSTSTDPSGQYNITGLAPGYYDLTATYSSYTQSITNNQVKTGQTTTVDFMLG